MYQPPPQPPSLPPAPVAPQNFNAASPHPDQALRHPGPGGRGPVIVATVALLAALFGAALGGLGGVLVGAHLSHPAPAASGPPPASTPTAEQVRNETVDLCTRFATGMHAMGKPQNTASDVVPMINYVTSALADNPAADSQIRAIAELLRLERDHGSALTREPTAGAIQPAKGWSADASNDAEERAWNLCQAYRG